MNEPTVTIYADIQHGPSISVPAHLVQWLGLKNGALVAPDLFDWLLQESCKYHIALCELTLAIDQINETE